MKKSVAPNWLAKCGEGDPSDCQISQTISVRQTGQHLLTVIVRQFKGGKQTHMLVGMPHKVYLPAGVVLQVDKGKARKSEIQFCDERACIATFAMDEAMLQSLKAGHVLSVTFENLMRKPITVPVTLIGFTAALKQIQ